MDNEMDNEIPPPPNAPHPNNVNASNAVKAPNAVNAVKAPNAVNAVKANASNAVKTPNAVNAVKAPNASNGNANTKTSTVTAYVPQQKGETVTFRQYTVETKIVDETREYTI
jgi:hypothetical protein